MQLFRNLHRLFAFLLRHTRQVRYARAIMAAVVVAGIASGLANAVLIGVVNHAINAGRGGGSALAWTFAAVCVLLPVTRYAAEFLLTLLSEKAMLNLRLLFTRRVLDAPLRELEEVGPARLMSTLTGDIPTVTGAVAVLPVLCMNLAVVVGCLVYMGILSPVLLLAVVVFLVLGTLAYQLPINWAQHHLVAARRKADELFRHFRAVTEGVKELKLNHERRRVFIDEELRGTVGELAGHGIAAQRLFTSAVSVAQALVFILIGLVAFVLPAYVSAGATVLSGYILAILYMVTPIQTLMNLTPQLGRATASMRRLEELKLSVDAVPAAPAAALPAPRATGHGWERLEVDAVTHAYHSERDGTTFTLGPVELAFRPGEIVFITGGNGSGKTTFAKLLTGLYTPESGEVRLDGRPLGEVGLARYQGLFAVVFSDFFLFDTLLGPDRRELDAEALHYLRELHLDHKVKVEGGRLSTTDLSQGQRKRLALLTAYLEDRSIYLFDEWAADQDPQFKHVFYQELLPRLKERGKTVFAISHDDRYYHVADRLIKLDSGQVVLDARRDEIVPLEVKLAPAGSSPAAHGA